MLQSSQFDSKLVLSGTRFCCTGIPSYFRDDLFQKITELGGKCFNHLMENVEVLIIGDYNTEKYKFCVKNRNDIIFVQPYCIEDIYKKFKEGGRVFDDTSNNFNKEKLFEDYKIQIFDSMSFCLCRLGKQNVIQDYHRESIQKSIIENGGICTESLSNKTTGVVSITKTGKRISKAIEWNIPVIHPRWIVDCIRRGGILELKYYNTLTIRDEDIGKGACNVWDQIEDRKVDEFKNFEIDNENVENLSRNKPITQDLGTEIVEERKNEKERVEKEKEYIFSGLNFSHSGFNEQKVSKLNQIIIENGGLIVSSEDIKNIDIFILSSSISIFKLPSVLRSELDKNGIKIVNEWLIERSIYYGKLIIDNWSNPRNFFNLNLKIKIHISGFYGIESLHIKKLIENVGCQFIEVFNPECDILIINLKSIELDAKDSVKLYSYNYPDIINGHIPENASLISTKKKINAAKAWNVPIMTMAFLWEISERGTIPNLLDYRWCLFCPKAAAPSINFMEYIRGISGNKFSQEKEKTKNQIEDQSKGINETYVTADEHAGNGHAGQFEAPGVHLSQSYHNKEIDIANKDANDTPNNGEFDLELESKLAESLTKSKTKPKNWGRLNGQAQESQLAYNKIHKLAADEPDIPNNRSKLRRRESAAVAISTGGIFSNSETETKTGSVNKVSRRIPARTTKRTENTNIETPEDDISGNGNNRQDTVTYG
ncbi:hypothetical protein B5S33_g5613 [[Candida] boidinii]|nr:hypothetical protein B5S33_g5613 [[Candida] boidinii]